jgi:nucleoid-associated protein YgaU
MQTQANEGKRMTSRGRLTALVVADAACLLGLWPDVGTVARHLRAPHAWVAAAGADRALADLAGAALWVTAAWLAAGLATVALGRLPGNAGAAARAFSRRVLPAAVYRLVAGSAGLAVLLTPVAAGAAQATPHLARAAVPAGSALPAPTWPVGPATLPPPHWPTRTDRSAGEQVRVRPGDSLWLIASRRLGDDATPRAVVREWHRWYAANRAIIGPDPSVIRPGQTLRAPAVERRP